MVATPEGRIAASLHPVDFVNRWRNVRQKESSVARAHFLDLCRVVGAPDPIAADPEGRDFSFERKVLLDDGDTGFADVWQRDVFAWEYKTRGKDLHGAYRQLLKYREGLDNPPLLVVTDTDRIQIHTNFTGHRKQVHELTLDTFAEPASQRILRDAFLHPYRLQPAERRETITEAVAAQFAQLAVALERRGVERSKAAHLLVQILFCFFAEDTGLLRRPFVTELAEEHASQPVVFSTLLQELLEIMRVGGHWGGVPVRRFNGGLFKQVVVVRFEPPEIQMLARAGQLDWENIEPSVIGVLFERSLDPVKRSQLGKFYTDRREIQRVVDSVVISPLAAEWERARPEAERLARKREEAIDREVERGTRSPTQAATAQRATAAFRQYLDRFVDRIAEFRVLDPACGSGNFLYVALAALQDFEKSIHLFGAENGLPLAFPRVSPRQVLGIEIDPYAQELAQVAVWIGYLQWMRDNGFQPDRDPVLSPLETIQRADALLSEAPSSTERVVWPDADVIIGNPPFMGGKLLRTRLGDERVDQLFSAYRGDVAPESDLCCYFFEQARQAIAAGRSKRAGLLATNSIRGGANRLTLERIKRSGDIFMAWDDEPWVLDGAAVRISIVGFDDGTQTERTLDGAPAERIHADLTGTVDATRARLLVENHRTGYMADIKGGPFEIEGSLARSWMALPANVNGRPNADVVRPWANGLDIVRRPRDIWIVDFGEMGEGEASCYEAPFEYLRRHVKPVRDGNRRERRKRLWWIHAETHPQMRRSIGRLPRFLATPTVAKHRLFAWLSSEVLPDHALIVFARDDDYFFGVLHSRAHEVWSLRMGTSLEDRPRYTPSTCFETFPLPWAPGSEPLEDPRHVAVAKAANKLDTLRRTWLNPSDASAADLKTRTLTNLYNARPTWLSNAHADLDRAVWAAYGWPADEIPAAVPEDTILARLLELNLERSLVER